MKPGFGTRNKLQTFFIIQIPRQKKKKNLRLESSSIGHYYVETLTANINEVL